MTDEKRPYRKKRRAELEEQTRRRITESAVALHGTLGPARTSISALAEHAGVRRSTVYRHFPDEAALFAACTAHWMADNPVPDIGRWAAIDDPDERLRAALDELYPYYRRTERMMENLIRDEPVSEVVRENFAGYPRVPRRRPRGARARPAARGAARCARARRDRPRAGLRDLALARAATRASTTRRPPSSCTAWSARRPAPRIVAERPWGDAPPAPRVRTALRIGRQRRKAGDPAGGGHAVQSGRLILEVTVEEGDGHPLDDPEIRLRGGIRREMRCAEEPQQELGARRDGEEQPLSRSAG